MSFYPNYQPVSEKSFPLVSATPPNEKEFEAVYAALKDDAPNASELVKNYRTKFLGFVAETGRKVEMVKNFLKLAALTGPVNYEIGMQLMKDCLIWYPGQHWVMSRYTMLLEANNFVQQAGNNYWKLLRRYPENPHAYTQLGNFLIKHNFFNMALVIYKAAVRNFPQDSVAHNCLADVYLKSGHFEKAISFYKESVQKYPQNPVSITGLADAYLKNRKYDESIMVYKTAKHLFPDDPVILSGLADAYLKSGNTKEAIECYTNVLKTHPNLLVSLSGLADAYLKSDQPKKSIETFEKALRLAPHNHVCLNGLGLAYLRQKEYAKAIEVLKRGVESMSNGPVCLASLGLVHLRSGDYASALNTYREGLERFPDNHFFYEGYVETLVRSEKLLEAKNVLEQALSKFSKIQSFNFALAEVYMLNKLYAEASYLVEDDATYLQDKVQSHTDKILLYVLTNNLEEARTALKKAQSLFPKDKEQLFITAELEKLIGVSKQKLSDDALEKAEKKIFALLSGSLLDLREEVRQSHAHKNGGAGVRRYAYYFNSIFDELNRYQKMGMELKTPLLLLSVLLSEKDPSTPISNEYKQILQLLDGFKQDYEVELTGLILSLVKEDGLQDAGSFLERVEGMHKTYGQKWELYILKALFDAHLQKSVDENLWKNIQRIFPYHSDLNNYCYATAYSLAQNKARSKVILERLLKKLQLGAVHQKLLWLFHHSKTSIKDFPDLNAEVGEGDMLLVCQSLLADFYLNMGEETAA